MAQAAQAAGKVALWLAEQVFKAVINSRVPNEDPQDGEVYLQCGKLVFDNVPANLRTELWLSQLHRDVGKGAATAALYSSMLAQGTLNPDVEAEIDKDTHRTFPGHPRLSTPAGQRAMLNVLMAYAHLDPEIGYCQGMNFVVGLLLSFLPREEDAYGALVLLMHDRQLRELYKPDMSLLQVRLWQLGKLLPTRLAAHLEAHGVLPVLFASSWFLTCFASDFPISFAARVLDVVMTDSYAAPMMKVAVGILEACSELLLEMQDMEMIVQHLKQDVPTWPKPALQAPLGAYSPQQGCHPPRRFLTVAAPGNALVQDLLTHALSKPWTRQQLEVLQEMNGAETVIEAVARVNELSRSHGQEEAEEGTAGCHTSGASGAVEGVDASFSGSTAARTLSQFSAVPTLGAAMSYGGGSAWGSFMVPPGHPRNSFVHSLPSPQPGIEASPSMQSETEAGAACQQLTRLPPPPTARNAKVSWEDWGPTYANLEAVPADQLRIEVDIKDSVELAPSLTQALSCLIPSGPDGAAAAQAAAAIAAPLVVTPIAAPPPALALSPSGAGGLEGQSSGSSLFMWNMSSLSSTTGLPSPFESNPSGRSSGGFGRITPSPTCRINSSPTPAASGSSGSLSDFGSFQRAATLVQPQPAEQAHDAARQQQQQQQQLLRVHDRSSSPALHPEVKAPPRAAAAALDALADKMAAAGAGRGGADSSSGSRAPAGAEAAPASEVRPPSSGMAGPPSAAGSLGSHTSSLAQVLSLLSVEADLHSSPRLDSRGAGAVGASPPLPPSPQTLRLAPPTAAAQPRSKGPVRQAAAAALQNYGSWQSAGSSQASLPRPVSLAPPAQPSRDSPAHAGPQPTRSLVRSISHPARLLPGSAISQGPQPGTPDGGLPGRSQSEQQESLRLQPASRAQQLQEQQLEGFLQSATPRSPTPMKAVRRA